MTKPLLANYTTSGADPFRPRRPFLRELASQARFSRQQKRELLGIINRYRELAIAERDAPALDHVANHIDAIGNALRTLNHALASGGGKEHERGSDAALAARSIISRALRRQERYRLLTDQLCGVLAEPSANGFAGVEGSEISIRVLEEFLSNVGTVIQNASMTIRQAEHRPGGVFIKPRSAWKQLIEWLINFWDDAVALPTASNNPDGWAKVSAFVAFVRLVQRDNFPEHDHSPAALSKQISVQIKRWRTAEREKSKRGRTL